MYRLSLFHVRHRLIAPRFSQNKLNKAVRGFIDEIREGKRDAATVSKALDTTLPDTEKDDAWQGLQKELEQFDLEPEISTRDHDFIITTLEKAAKEEDLLKSLQQEPFSDKEITLGSPKTQPFEIPLPGTGPCDTDKIAVPHSLSDLPIPTSTDLEGTSDFEKQVLHNERLRREERLLLSATYCPGDDADKEAFYPETFPVPYTAEPESSDTYTSTQSRSDGSSASVHYSTTKLRMSRGKKPSIVKKMKFKLTTSKEEFIRLVQAGGLYTVKNALDSGAEVDTYNSQGLTALMVAVACGHEQIVDLLLEYGADSKRRTAWGDTALSLAAAKGYEEIVRTLLTHGSSLDGYGAVSKGKTAMSQAAEGGHENIVRLLFNAGANINGISHTGETALSQAAQNGHIDIVRYLLDNGALVDHVGYPRRTALYKAVERDHLDVIKLLLERGADVDCAESIQGMTPSLLTAIHNKDEIADIMRQKQYRPALQHQGRAYTAPHRFRYH